MPHHSEWDAGHVAACDDCQARASLDTTALDVDLEKAWIGVAAESWAGDTSPPEGLAGRLIGPGLARALVTTPSLILSWVLATAAVLAAGALATPVSGDPWVALLAPALAGAGIAYSYGPGVDPAFELSRTMVVSDRVVLLARALAVFGLNACLGLVASLFTEASLWITIGWLVPMTSVCALALAAASLARSANVGVMVALCAWGMTVLAASARTRDLATAVADGSLIPFYAVATAALAALTLYWTRSKREEGSAWR